MTDGIGESKKLRSICHVFSKIARKWELIIKFRVLLKFDWVQLIELKLGTFLRLGFLHVSR